MPSDKRQLSFRPPDDLRDWVEAYAEEHDLTITAVVAAPLLEFKEAEESGKRRAPWQRRMFDRAKRITARGLR